MTQPPAPQPARYRGKVEAIDDGRVVGWVVAIPDRGAKLPVGLFFKHRLLSVGSANLSRPDFDSSGIGDGRHAFALPFTNEQALAALRGGGEVSVRVMDGSRVEIGRFLLGELGRDDPHLRPGLIRAAVDRELDVLARLLEQTLATTADDAHQAHDPIFNALFRTEGASTNATVYLRFILERTGRTDDPDLPSTLDWYVSSYGADRPGRRIPLSRRQIEFLNQPVAIGGNGFELSRLTTWKLPSNAFLAAGAGSGDEAWHDAVLYWWSVHRAKDLNVEDCLVPDWYAHRLRTVRSMWNLPDYPLSIFMEHWLVGHPQLRFLDARKREDRLILSAILLVKAVERPDFLKYIPQSTIDVLLQQPGSFWTALFGQHDHPDLFDIGHDSYARLLKTVGYDMSTHTFSSVTPLGHRLDAARLPRPDNEKPFDVQVIGPLSKSSGLGQSTRLSAEILRHTPFSINAVDFTLDDPGSRNPGSPAHYGELGRSRINLIHLNGDALPPLFAYAPDVFTGAWNIGYFFWELDSANVCDHLAFPFLDEVWVASEFNFAIYAGASGLPVTKVGMSFEAFPNLARRTSRQALEQRLGLAGHEFVFMAAFDAFSFIQRKNPLGALDAFRRAFPHDPDVRLLIKTQNRSRVTDPAQLAIWSRIDRRALADPRIVLIDETLPYDHFLQLKQGSDCYVSLHRSEGWGFGMIEAMNLQVPVICTAYSGNMDFCSDATAWLVDHRMVPVASGDYIHARDDHRWAEPDVKHAARQMQAVRADAATRRKRTAAAWRNVQKNFSAEAVSVAYRKRIAEILEARPQD